MRSRCLRSQRTVMVRTDRRIWPVTIHATFIGAFRMHSPRELGGASGTYTFLSAPVSRSSPQLRAFLMPSHYLLQQLDRLDGSPSKFHNQLNNILHGEEFKQSLLNLQGDDLTWLVDYLDGVRRQIALPHSPLKFAKAIDGLDPSAPAFSKCLHELRSICGARTILPTSYILSGTLRGVGSLPFTLGGSGDIYEGILDGTRVSIKRVRMHSKGNPGAATKVRDWCCSNPCLPLSTSLVDPLPRGCSVETPSTSEYRPPPRYHFHSSPAYLGVDDWRRPDGTCQEEPQCRPSCTCGHPSCCAYPMLTPVASCPTSLGASATSTPAM